MPLRNVRLFCLVGVLGFFLRSGKRLSHSKTTLEIIPALLCKLGMSYLWGCKTVKKIIPPDLLRVANVSKLNAKCEKQGESEKIYKARKTLLKNTFVIFFLKLNSNHQNLTTVKPMHWCFVVFCYVSNRPISPFAKNIPQFKTELPPPLTKMISTFFWKSSNFVPI